ncbi:hypothetical protein [Deefgea rivuli]|uniref:hypothetical protein n=1 Tax=Deefgea rivuli TaxID=400948 RepID=UPI0004831622|nr:hypothetical protein [Deefgea rivuli]
MSNTETIELCINSIEQLFNSLDPAPFRERELDRNAERYILSASQKMPSQSNIELLIYLPPNQIAQTQNQPLELAIRHHFQLRAQEQVGDIEELRRLGHKGLLFGFMIMLLCTLLSITLMNSFPSSGFIGTLEQSLIIFGWVALWRPIEILLYDRWPLVRRHKLLQKLCNLNITIKATVSNPASSTRA